MGRTPLDQAGDIGWQGIGIGLNEQVDMIRLNCQFHHAPAIFAGDLLDDLFQLIMDWTGQDLASTLGAEENNVEAEKESCENPIEYRRVIQLLYFC